jgi:hypothetical protein
MALRDERRLPSGVRGPVDFMFDFSLGLGWVVVRDWCREVIAKETKINLEIV